MRAIEPFTIGADVCCEDGRCGRLKHVVLNPVTRTLTHVVVEPTDGESRLVPVDLVVAAGGAGGEAVLLHCTAAQLARLEPAQLTQFLPDDGQDFGYEPHQLVFWPYFPLAMSGAALAAAGLAPGDPRPRSATYDRVPPGEVAIRRGDRVQATDGAVGHVQGLAVDPADHGVTHVLLREGHLWGKKTVAIPIREVTPIAGDLHVRMSKAELADLPPVDLATDL